MKNWKTTLAAVIIALSGAATAMNWITPEVLTAILTIAGACGFALAKDHNTSDE